MKVLAFILVLIEWLLELAECEHHKEHLSDTFLVRVMPSKCSGSLIARDWVVSAAHCYDTQLMFSQNKDGDRVASDPSEQSVDSYEVEVLTNYTGSPSWSRPIKADTEIPLDSLDHPYLWKREVQRIILHRDFETEALSWKGSDFALIQLRGPWQKAAGTGAGQIAPVCLPPDDNFAFDKSLLWLSGHGHRNPLCVTDAKGQEPFGVCRVRKDSSDCNYRQRRLEHCQPDFDYDGHHYQGCIDNLPVPQKEDECEEIRKKYPDSSNKTVHVLVENMQRVAKTCFPKFQNGGWCLTESFGVSDNGGPETKWGFCQPNNPVCASAESESKNKKLELRRDSTPQNINILSESYCTRQLELNLEFEQPKADFFAHKHRYLPLLNRTGLFCAGHNVSHKNDESLYYSHDSERMVQFPWKDVVSVDSMKTHDVSGGPACFGDSGGPAWSVNDKKVPVLVGVFSFLLWGSCGGNHDPGYFGSVQRVREWILNYVPESETCTAHGWIGKEEIPLERKKSILSKIQTIFKEISKSLGPYTPGKSNF